MRTESIVIEPFVVQFRERLSAVVEIPPAEWNAFRSILRHRVFRRGQHLVRADEKPHQAIFLVSGLMRSYFQDSQGRDRNLEFFRAGDLAASFTALLTRGASRLSIEALEDTECLTFGYFEFEAFYDRHPCWQELGRKMSHAFCIQHEKREYEFLALSTSARYHLFRKEQPEVFKKLAQYHIASYLGVTPEGLSRSINAR